MIKDIYSTLNQAGLSNSEAQVYVSLLKIGEAKISDISKLVQISSSNIHEACNKLIKKGCISYILKNNIRYFYPSETNALLELFNVKKNELNVAEDNLKELIPQIDALKKISEKAQKAEVFTGLSGIKNAFHKLFSQQYKDQEYLFFYKYDELNVEIVHNFFQKMDIEKLFENVPTRGLFSHEYEPLFKRRKNTIKAKFTKHPIPSSVNIYGDKTLIISWTENPLAFLIQSKEITQTHEELFEDIWKLK